jgi:subtilisin family serine protease
MTGVITGPMFRYMALRLAVLACTAGGLLLLVASSAAGTTFAAESTSATDATVVGYMSEAALTDAVAESGGVVTRRISPLRVAEVRGAALATLAAHPGIAYLERPRRRSPAAEPGLLFATQGIAPEWQYAATRADAVPESVLRAAGSIRIAVLDTGADLTAPDLASKSPQRFNVRTQTDDVRDTNGHGTFVASLAAGSATNGEGIAGFGGDAQLLVVKAASGSNMITDVDEAAAIVYAVDHGARIVNLSFGGPSTSTTERRAVDYAVARGVLLIAAVGNDFERGNPVHYPAALLQPVGSAGRGGAGLSVAASTIAGTRAAFSNTGTHVSVAAPGEDVLGAVSSLSSSNAYPRIPLAGAQTGLYGYGSGTSFAAPQVAGAAALVWAANPALSAQQVAEIIESTASGRGSWNSRVGYGVIDVAGAVARAAGAPLLRLTGERERRRVHLAWQGAEGFRYRLTVSVDGRPGRIVLDDTERTSASFRGAPGHTYGFAVSALDDAGGVVLSSNTLRVSFTP